jgi:hypothetical protein
MQLRAVNDVLGDLIKLNSGVMTGQFFGETFVGHDLVESLKSELVLLHAHDCLLLWEKARMSEFLDLALTLALSRKRARE